MLRDLGINTHFYSLAVEAGFYGNCSRVVGSFTKLSKVLGWVTACLTSWVTRQTLQ